jgi:DNA-binding SARP family transcriptional activator
MHPELVLQIRLFDGPRVRAADDWVAGFRSQKAEALFTYLALAPERPHRRDLLCELLWDESPLDLARNSLTTSLWSVRRVVEQAGLPHRDVLRADRQTVQLHPRLVTVDAAVFTAEITRRCAPEERVDVLRSAISRYGGGLAPGLDEPCLANEQTRFAALYGAALTELTDLLRQAGRLDEAIPYASKRAECDPYDEAAHEQLMRLYIALGQRGAAQDVGTAFLARLSAAELRAGSAIPALLKSLRSGATAVAPDLNGVRESIGGAVRPGSALYVRRPSDAALQSGLRSGEGVIRVTGPRESGKSSLLSEGERFARAAGWRLARTSLRTFADVDSGAACCRRLAETLADSLGLPLPEWSADRAAGLHLRAFLREALTAGRGRLLWTLDDVDLLFERPFAAATFGLLRSWYEEGASDADGPWSRLTLLLSYSAEVHLHAVDPNQSPFNIGLRLEVGDFTPAETAELVARHAPVPEGVTPERLMALLGGHPLLLRKALDVLVHEKQPWSALEATALRPGSPFRPHLAGLRQTLGADLAGRLAALAQREVRPDEEEFYRLRSAGVLAGDDPAGWRFRCELYRRWFSQSH